MMNPFWDNNNIFVNAKPHRYHDGYTNHTIESHRRLKQMTKSPLKKETKIVIDLVMIKILVKKQMKVTMMVRLR